MSVRNYAILWPDRKSSGDSGSISGGNQLLSVGQHALDGAEHTGQLPETRISTTETNTALVLHPDGVGGVEWDTDATGGAGSLPWFDVTDPTYGAVGDGTTDDALAIQAAIDAACTAGGGVVYLPANTYLISAEASGQRYGINLDCDNVTLQGDGMFLSVLDFDSTQTLPAGSVFLPIEIGTATTGVVNVTIQDVGLIANHSALTAGGTKFIEGIAARHNTTTSAHSDDITIRRVRVVDANTTIYANKGGTTGSARTASRHQRWTIDSCLVEDALNKAFELAECEDSAIVDCEAVNVYDGGQFHNYTVRSVMARNRFQYKDSGINITEGCSDIEVYDNICTAIAGGGIGFTGGLIIRRESFASTGPTSSRVKIHHNIFDDTANAAGTKTGMRFASYTGNTGTGTFEDYEIYGNTFRADMSYLRDTEFPTKTQAVRLRVYDNHFTDDVTSVSTWVSGRTRLERNTIQGDLTVASANWDLRGNVVGGTLTVSGSGATYDDGYINNVLVSATPPSSGMAPTASAGTAAAWGNPTPGGSAGGDLSGTYPNPSVVDDSHSHTASTLPSSVALPHVHVVDETHLSNGSGTTYTLDQNFEPGSVQAFNTTTLAYLTVVEAQPDQATVSAAGSSGDKITFSYAATVT